MFSSHAPHIFSPHLYRLPFVNLCIFSLHSHFFTYNKHSGVSLKKAKKIFNFAGRIFSKSLSFFSSLQAVSAIHAPVNQLHRRNCWVQRVEQHHSMVVCTDSAYLSLFSAKMLKTTRVKTKEMRRIKLEIKLEVGKRGRVFSVPR